MRSIESTPSELYKTARELYIWSNLPNEDLASGFPLLLAEGEGVRVRDVDGNTYVDLTSTASRASALGYADRRMADAIHEQLMRLHHAGSGPLQADTVMELAALLADVLPGDLACSVFTGSGSEANEVAIKLAKLFQRSRGKPRAYKVISRWNAYHGSLGSAQEVSDWLGVRVPSEPGPPGVSRIPAPESGPSLTSDNADLSCADFLADHIEHEGPDLVAAFILEPIAQANGVQIPPPGYLRRIREICDHYDVLLIADEVITGFGRTGKWFAVQHWDIEPDIMTLGKAITAGYVPLAATVARREIGEALSYFPDVHTYCGHASAAVAASTAIGIYESDGLVERAAALGPDLLEALQPLSGLPCVKDVRGVGLWAAVEFDLDNPDIDHQTLRKIVMSARQRGVIVSQNGRSIEVAPPFVISEEDLTQGVAAFVAAVDEVCT
jgi:putrescine---pyruvate transaminase